MTLSRQATAAGEHPSLRRRPAALAGLVIFACALWFAQREARRPHLAGIPDIDSARYSVELKREVEALLASLRSDPADAQGNGQLAMLLHAHQEMQPAELFYQRAGQLDANSSRWPYLRALTLYSLNRIPDAVAALRQAGRIDPNDAFIQTKLCEFLAASGRNEEALQVARSTLRIDGQHHEASFRAARLLAAVGRSQEALDHLRQLPPSVQGHQEVLYLIAELSRRTGDHAGALRFTRDSQAAAASSWPDPHFESVQLLRTGSPRVWIDRGLAAERSGDINQAVAAYRKALDLDARFVPAHINLISSFAKSGEPERATHHYHAALALDANFEELHYNYGVLQLSLGNVAAAAASFRQALRLNSASVEAHYNLGYCLLQMGRVADAQRQLQKTLELRPGHALALIQLGALELKSGNRADAAKRFELALAQEAPPRAEYLYAIANAFYRAGYRADALSHAQQARDAASQAGLSQVAANAQKAVDLLSSR